MANEGLKALLIADQRLVILRLLSEALNYQSNCSFLNEGLGLLGYSVSRDTVRNQLRWLAAQDLVAITGVNSSLVATLTERGQDVAEGKAVVEGVKRPRAGD